MSRADEIYNFKRQIENELERIRLGSDVNKDTLIRFYKQSVAEGLSIARVRKRLATARYLSEMLGTRFEDAGKEDIITLLMKIEQRDFSAWTKVDYKRILKLFFKWLRGSDVSPPEVRWIRINKNIPSRIMKKDLLTPEEQNRIIERARNIQDKALFSTMFDSGRRPGEILGLRVCDVEFDSLGAKLRVEGKEGEDFVRVCAAQPRLSLWLDNHPERNNREAPLWIIRKNGRVKQLSYNSARKRLRTAVQEAGVNKRVWFYLMRHSRITPASKRLSYTQMCHVFGWKQGSDMPKFYVHLAGDDRDEAFLKMNGLESRNRSESNSDVYVPIICPRCNRSNSPDAKFCNGCGLGLDLKHAVEADEKKQSFKDKLNVISDELSKSPEIVDSLIEALTMAKSKK